MLRSIAIVGSLALVAALPAACSTAPKTEADRKILSSEVQTAITKAKEKNPNMSKHFGTAYAYVVIPNVGKGAFIVGGAYGRGEVFKDGKLVGYCDVSQGSFGAQVGGQGYTEFLFFQSKEPYDKFVDNQFVFAANASAVAADAGAGTANDYQHGVAVFVTQQAGLMLEAAIGGQQFNFVPLAAVEAKEAQKGASK
jgi:lipid-binding SYLF domain-containing protein